MADKKPETDRTVSTVPALGRAAPGSGAPARCDVAVVGAGVVGAAVARRFQLDGASVVVLEAAREVLDGASKGNSGILHTGFDAPVGSLEARCVAEGREEYLAIRESLGLPLLQTGALVLAWDDEQAGRLPELLAQAHANGVADAGIVSAAQARSLEGGLAPDVCGALRVPGEAVIDPWSAAHAYLLQALLNGAQLWRGAPLTAAEHGGDGWLLHTAVGQLRARTVVLCAGLHGDTVERLFWPEAAFNIRPRKGQFVVYDAPAARLARHILLPVPTAVTKGIVICRTAWGKLLVGPTAEEQESRIEAATDAETLRALMQRGQRILPGLSGQRVIASYAGLRPATEHKDYCLRLDAARGLLSIGGIRSTGLSAALGLARHAARLLTGEAEPLATVTTPRMPWLAEDPDAPGDTARDWARPGHGGIICHCEGVTRRELLAAMEGPLAASSFAGLKRRTRVTMGRCQGFNCLADVVALSAGRFDVPPGSAMPSVGGASHDPR
jgi:glycerol-3-phosphate dehydrogenase